MPHLDVLLTDAQARFLGKRAKATNSTPRAVLQLPNRHFVSGLSPEATNPTPDHDNRERR